LTFWPTLWPKGSADVAPKPRRNLIALASFAPARMRSGGHSGPRDPIFRSCPIRPPLAEAFLDFPGFHCIVARFVGTPFAIIADRCTSLHFIAFRFISLHRCNRCMQRLQRCNEKRCARVSTTPHPARPQVGHQLWETCGQEKRRGVAVATAKR